MLRCIKNSIDAGMITLEDGQAVQKRIDDVLRSGIGPSKARELVAKELEAEAFEKKRRALLTESRRQVLEPQVLGYRNASGQHDPAEAFIWLHEHQTQAPFMDVETLQKTIMSEAHTEMNRILDEFRRGAILGDKSRLYGRQKARLDNVVRELFGQETGDKAAKEMAASWEKVSDDLRQRFNAAGGAVRKLEKWGLPQHHNAEALLTVGKDQWIANIMPLLDTDRMVSQRTGAKLAPAELRDALGTMWERITSDGWFDREPTGASYGKGAVFRQHADHRFLHFKNADAWLKYQRDFGEADPFSAMMGHVSTMARDIAHMEIFGPNPAAMREYLKQVVMKSAADYRPAMRLIVDAKAEVDAIAAEMKAAPTRWQRLSGELGKVHDEMNAIRQRYRPQLGGKPSRRDRARLDQLNAELMRLNKELAEVTDQFGPNSADVPPELAARFQAALDKLGRLQERPIPWDEENPMSTARSAFHTADKVWEFQRGTYNAPVNDRAANAFAATRSFITSTVLGGAIITAMSDVVFQTVARKYVGLPATGMLKDVVRLFTDTSLRHEAVAANLMLDSAVHAMHSQARYVGGLNARHITTYLADRTIALQGLSAWTQRFKWLFGMAMQREYAKRAGLAMDEMPSALRQTLQRAGISAAEWDAIRASQLYAPDPSEPLANFLRPAEIAKSAGPKLAEKYTAMIFRETRFATPEGFLRSQSKLVADRPGTLAGEVTRNFAQYKSFGIAAVFLHGGRVFRDATAGRKLNGAYYAGGILLGGMLAGALSLQLKEIIGGRDPRDMDNAGFWGAALLQSGGLGIYGDFLFANVNRFGGGLSSTIAGPLPERINRLRNSTIGNAFKLADPDANPNVGRDLSNLARDWMPGSSLWYLRLAYNRILMDQLQEMLDPDAKKAWRRQQQKRKSEFGNDFWWAPGKASPERLPAF